MPAANTIFRPRPPEATVEARTVLAALPDPVLVVDDGGRLRYANPAAEEFFDAGAVTLMGLALTELLPADSPLFALIESVRVNGHSVSEYGVGLDTPRMGSRLLTIQAAPLGEEPGYVVVTLQGRSIADKIDRQLTHRNAARSVTAMAAMLAHEVKNPLSGIRGAAQLLEQNASAADRELTRLICDEADRICALVDRMDVFSDRRPLERGNVNIHEVLERVRRAAQSGFARNLRFVEEYDPSLPPVLWQPRPPHPGLPQSRQERGRGRAAAGRRDHPLDRVPAGRAAGGPGQREPRAFAAGGFGYRQWRRAFPKIFARISSIPSSPPSTMAAASDWHWSRRWSATMAG